LRLVQQLFTPQELTMKTFLFALLAATAAVSPASAQTTYWLPTIKKTDRATTYTYDVKVPKYFGEWLRIKTQIGGGTVVTKTIDGQTRQFMKQTFTWVKPLQKSGVNIETNAAELAFGGGQWKSNDDLKTQNGVIAALQSSVIDSDATYAKAEVLALIHQGETPPGLVFTENASESNQLHAQMKQLAKNTRPGKYFPETRVPTNMEAFRQAVLTIGNAARRDPNYRRDNGMKTATDLSGEKTLTKNGWEKVYKNRPNPPYFDDVAFYKELNEACQYWAEYQAKIQQAGHKAPGLTYKGDDMSNEAARFKHFSGFAASVAEGAGGPGEADSCPEGWLHTETHYRPWFNVGGETTAMGFGFAQSPKDGKWYSCKIAMLNDKANVKKLTPAQLPKGGGTKSANPNGIDTVFPLSGQFSFTRNKQYFSPSGKHYLLFQDDGNLVVYSSKGNQFVWGLNLVTKQFGRNATATKQTDGNLVTRDANQGFVWGAREVKSPKGSTLTITDDGKLQIIDPVGTVLWSSQ